MHNNTLPPEMKLLLCCGRRDARDGHDALLREARNAPLDWDKLLRLAKRHKLRPQLHRHLRASAFCGVPPPTARRLTDFAQVNSLRNLSLTAQLGAVLRLLHENGVDALALKGPVLATSLYGDLSLREFHDLDVFVRRRHVPRVHMLLTAWGCRLTPPAVRPHSRWEEKTFLCLTQENVYTYLLPDGRSHLELHWALIPPSLGMLVPFDEAWSRRQICTVAGFAVPTLGDADLLVYLAAHGAKHRWKRLEWLCSLGELARRAESADWEQAWRIARRTSSTRLLHLALTLLTDLWGDPPVPACSLPPRLRETIWRLMQEDAAPEQSLADAAFYVEARERLQDRLLCRLRLLASPSFGDLAFLSQPLRRFPLYLLIRPFRLLCKHGDRKTVGCGSRKEE